jgi:predicted nucleic acid-binding protein
VRLFIDSSVALAACGRPGGASRVIVNAAAANGWELVSSEYSIAEVTRNLGKLPGTAASEWPIIAGRLRLVRDAWTSDRPAVFGVAKDRPVLFTAAAWADVLLTLDTADFLGLLGSTFYALQVLTPGMFLEWQRAAGKLRLDD